jgi:small redox-active disulfide protein 2
MQVQIIGPGCVNCRRLYEQAEKALADTGIQAELVKVEDPDEIAALDVWMTPGIAIDGVVKSLGRVPAASTIATMLVEAVSRRDAP